MCRLSRLELLARICNLSVNRDAARPVGRFMSRLSRPYDKNFNTQTLGANGQFGSKSGCTATLMRLIITLSRSFVQTFPTRTLGAARPLARFLSRLFRPYDKTFNVETLGATLQFGSKSECGATLGTILVQTVQNLCADFPDSNCWRKSAFWV